MIFDNINSEQKEAIKYEGHCLIQACPGSGKTHVLTRKIAFELKKLKDQGNTRQYVIGLTYTNRAADEINKRVFELLGSTKQLWVGTIHAFCLEWILRPYAGYHEDLKAGFVIVDNAVSEEFKQRATDSCGVSGWFTSVLRTEIKIDGTYPYTNGDLNRAVDIYYKHMRQERYVDFNLMLYYAFDLINNYPQIPKFLSRIFKIILVDEYQDTQEYQYAIIHEIIKSVNGQTNLFYVGDPNQAIFTSLGGRALSKEDIDTAAGISLYDGIKLNGCYRSTQKMIDYYSEYQISPLKIEALNKDVKELPGLITHNEVVPHSEVVDRIAALIKAAKTRGVKDSDICVIAPVWYFIYNLGRKLRSKLPDISLDAPGLFLFRADPFNIYFQLARLILTDPSPQLLPHRIRWVKELLNEFEAAYEGELPLECNTPRNLLRLLNSIQSEKEDGVDYLLEITDSFFSILNINIESNLTFRTHKKSFFNNIKKKKHADADVPTDTVSLRKMFQKRKGVVVTTCHQVKGEEYDTVICYGVIEGRIPYHSWNGPDDQSENEAKKMLYVVSSRAKTHLHLISERGRKIKDTVKGTTEIVSLYDYNYDPIA